MCVVKDFSIFSKQRDLLICVDSDGCAMNTMEIKHFICFGPCMIEEWSLERWRKNVLELWGKINLYSITRGINRFKGLALALCEINDIYCEIKGTIQLKQWTDSASELSNAALEQMIEKSAPDNIFKKALNWSRQVNEAIKNLPDDKIMPFPMVAEALELAHKYADVAIVSSANLDAVIEEWGEYGLLDHVDVVMSQNDGNKADCIKSLLNKGYINKKVVICGDAPGDLEAARKNQVYFFPILVGKERTSWEEFIDQGVTRLINNNFDNQYQEEKIKEFYTNLGK